MIFSELPSDPTIYQTLGTYHPKRQGTNPNFNQYSQTILDLKGFQRPALDYFYQQINALLTNEEFTIVVVPSHEPTHLNSGMKVLARMLCQNSNRVDGTSCLVRHTFVPKAATGGPRSLEIHFNSIRVDHLNLITGREVLLLDDVTTSHSSLSACQQLLQQHSPKLVVCYALGQTA